MNGEGLKQTEQSGSVMSVLSNEDIYAEMPNKSGLKFFENRFIKNKFIPVGKITGEVVQLLENEKLLFALKTKDSVRYITYIKDVNDVYEPITDQGFYFDILDESQILFPKKVDERILIEAMSKEGCTFANLHEMLTNK